MSSKRLAGTKTSYGNQITFFLDGLRAELVIVDSLAHEKEFGGGEGSCADAEESVLMPRLKITSEPHHVKLRHLGEAFELFLLVRIERKPVAAEADIQNAKAGGAFRHRAPPDAPTPCTRRL